MHVAPVRLNVSLRCVHLPTLGTGLPSFDRHGVDDYRSMFRYFDMLALAFQNGQHFLCFVLRARRELGFGITVSPARGNRNDLFVKARLP